MKKIITGKIVEKGVKKVKETIVEKRAKKKKMKKNVL